MRVAAIVVLVWVGVLLLAMLALSLIANRNDRRG
jgi:hypothetical protein